LLVGSVLERVEHILSQRFGRQTIPISSQNLQKAKVNTGVIVAQPLLCLHNLTIAAATQNIHIKANIKNTKHNTQWCHLLRKLIRHRKDKPVSTSKSVLTNG